MNDAVAAGALQDVLLDRPATGVARITLHRSEARNARGTQTPAEIGKESRMQCRIFGFVALCVVALVLAGCASTSIRSAWYDTSYTGGAFKKILVVGIGGNIAGTRVFEDIFTQKLRATGVDGIPGYQTLPAGVRPGDPAWNAAVEASGAEALLSVRLLRVDTKTQVVTTMVPGPMMWGPFGGWYGPAMVAVPEVQQYDVAAVETNLWDVKTHRVVWAATTDTLNPSSVAKETPGFADVIIGQLAARGLVPVGK